MNRAQYENDAMWRTIEQTYASESAEDTFMRLLEEAFPGLREYDEDDE